MSGYLDHGQWRTGWYDTGRTGGDFVRADAGFRQRISADGSSGFAAEPGRYHLYVSLACPWAHRTLIVRKLKALDDVVSASIVDPVMRDDGWAFSDARGCIPDSVNHKPFLRDIYLLADPAYSGRVTVPVLWDKRSRTIVSNESADIMRMLNREFDAFTPARLDLYPAELAAEIDAVNARVYEDVNNGVYRCGFAGSQAAYESAFDQLFLALDALEARLSQRRWLVGEQLTEADVRLFTTLIRFDAVYHGHFKCNLRRIADYPALSRLLRESYRWPGVAETVDLDHIKRHYYQSHRHLNPGGIVPKGPQSEFAGLS